MMIKKSRLVSTVNRAIHNYAGLFLFLLFVGKAVEQPLHSYPLPLTSVRAAPFFAHGDGVSNDRAAFQMALTSGMSIYVPAGIYLIDNSAGPLVISGFSSTLQFSPAAELVCNTPYVGCLFFSGGNSPTFLNLHVTYLSVPTNDCRGGEKLCVTLFFDGIHSPIVDGTLIENAWAIGVSVNNTDNAKIQNTTILNSTRDGLYLQDNQNVEVTSLFVENSGDDCIGFHATLDGGGRKGGTASDIICQHIRGGGIAFAGGQSITVSNFIINGTSAQGIYLLADPSQNYLAPSDITIAHGVIRGVGSVADTVPRRGTVNGIQYYTSGGMTIGTLRFQDIVIASTAGYGVIGQNAQSVSFDGLHITNAGLDGVVSDGSCAKFWAHGSLTVTNSSIDGCYATGLLAIGNTGVSINELAINNVNSVGGNSKALDLVQNATINVNGISVNDNRNPASGYILNENQNGSGQITKIYSRIAFGTFRLIHGDPSVSIVP